MFFTSWTQFHHRILTLLCNKNKRARIATPQSCDRSIMFLHLHINLNQLTVVQQEEKKTYLLIFFPFYPPGVRITEETLQDK